MSILREALVIRNFARYLESISGVQEPIKEIVVDAKTWRAIVNSAMKAAECQITPDCYTSGEFNLMGVKFKNQNFTNRTLSDLEVEKLAYKQKSCTGPVWALGFFAGYKFKENEK